MKILTFAFVFASSLVASATQQPDEGTGPARLRTRVRIQVNPDGNFRFTEQTATGDADWTKEEVVIYRKVG